MSASRRMRVALTGATGCIGSYVARALAAREVVDVTLMVRDAGRVAPSVAVKPNVRVVSGDLLRAESFAAHVRDADVLVLAATSWGEQATEINVDGVLALVDAAVAAGVAHIVYLSTASILRRDGSLLPEAASIGTPYIRSKLEATRALLARRDVAVTIVYPTLVVGGGDGIAPESHLARLLREVAARSRLLRFVAADGSFHLVHAADVATLIVAALDDPPRVGTVREIVAGGAATDANTVLDAILRARGRWRLARVPVNGSLAELLIGAFRVQLAPWDRFCFAQRHFTYDRAILPSALGLADAHGTLDSLLASSLGR